VDFTQGGLGISGNLGRKRAECGQLSENLPGAGDAPQSLEFASHRQKAIREIELHAHVPASVQQTKMRANSSATADYNPSRSVGKSKAAAEIKIKRA
jgi:hypothetical protein